MKKRDVFAELTEGFDALRDARAGKVTLRTHVAATPALVDVTAADVLALRQHLNVSRAVLAARLRINQRTLENWEQGRAKPNAQAALLIRLVARYPQMMEQLASV